MDVKIEPNWDWTSRWHSKNEMFTLIIDDETEILHSESFSISVNAVKRREIIECNFFLPYRD